jgi:Tfp pilus assembly protein PilN
MRVINLLPKPRQEELRYEALFHSAAIAATLAVALLLAVLVIQLGIRVYLSRHAKTTEQKTEQIKRLTNKEENNKLKKEIQLMNVRMADYKALADATPAWSQVLTAFAAHVPEGVKIRDFAADAATKKVTIAGFAATRDQVIQLYNNINGDKERFRDIDYPLENVSAPTEVEFHYTFFIQDKLFVLRHD